MIWGKRGKEITNRNTPVYQNLADVMRNSMLASKIVQKENMITCKMVTILGFQVNLVPANKYMLLDEYFDYILKQMGRVPLSEIPDIPLKTSFIQIATQWYHTYTGGIWL